jgi:hypothetical protein
MGSMSSMGDQNIERCCGLARAQDVESSIAALHHHNERVEIEYAVQHKLSGWRQVSCASRTGAN